MRAMSHAEKVWVGTIISYHGRLLVPHRGKPRVQFLFSDQRHPELAERLAEIMGTYVYLRNRLLTVKIQGDELDKLMDKVWDHLTERRRLEYNGLVARQQELMRQRIIRARMKKSDRLYWQSKPKPTEEQRREYLEANYDNSDPAVQVIRDSDTIKPAEYDLAMAQFRRDQEAARQRADMPWIDYEQPKRKKKK